MHSISFFFQPSLSKFIQTKLSVLNLSTTTDLVANKGLEQVRGVDLLGLSSNEVVCI